MNTDKITIWFEIRSSDRICLNQISVICYIAKKLLRHYKSIVIIIAGWSLNQSPSTKDLSSIEKDQKIFFEIQKKLFYLKNIKLISAIKINFVDKLALAKISDLYICSLGGHIFGSIFDKKIISYSNLGWYPKNKIENRITERRCDFNHTSSFKLFILDEKYIKDFDDKHFHVRNYFISSSGLLELLNKVLQIK